MQPTKKMKVCAGVGTLISELKIIICMALIIPNSCCMDPPRRREITKLLDEKKLSKLPTAPVVDYRLAC